MTLEMLDLRQLPAAQTPEDPGRRDASMTWMRFMNIDPNDPSTFGALRDYGLTLEQEGWVYSVVNKTSTACQGVPLRVYQRVGKDLIPNEDIAGGEIQAAGERLQHLLEWVNPVDMTGSDLKAYNSMSWNLFGGYYLNKVRGPYGGEPRELYWLHPRDVDVDAPDGRVVRTYHYHPKAGPLRDIEPADMIVHKRPNPNDPIDFLSPLASVKNEIQVQILAAEETAALLRNHSVPRFAVIAQKGAELDSTDERVLQRIFKAIRGPKGAGRTPIITEPVDIKQLVMSALDAQYLQAREIGRMVICSTLGMPRVVAGDDDKTNVYGNIRDARRAWWQDTVVPYLDGQADTYNNWLVPDFDPTGTLVVGYDYGQIEALQEPFATQIAAWMMLSDRGHVVGNEVRAHFRLGKPVTWGDQPMPVAKLTLKGDAVTGTGLGTALFGTDPVASVPLVEEPGGLPEVTIADLGGAERAASRLAAYGKNLYQHPAVRSWTADREQAIDADWLVGEPVTSEIRSAIEAGLRRRDSADQIAAALRGATDA